MVIAVFYFAVFCASGVLVPYLPAYFRSLGFSGQETANLTSLTSLAMIFAPPLWGFIADRTGKAALLLQTACIGSAAAFSFLLGLRQFGTIAVVMGIYALFWTAILALADTLAIAEARRIGTQYARLRVWGSMGFIASTYGYGFYLSHGGANGNIVAVGLILLCVVAVVSLLTRRMPAAAHVASPSIADAVKLGTQPAFLLFLFAGMVHWSAQQTYYLLFGIHMRDLFIAQKMMGIFSLVQFGTPLKQLSVGPEYIGLGFSLGVCAEVVMMFAFRRVSERVRLFPLLTIAFLLSSLRWLLVSLTGSGILLALIQVLHAFSFGAFYVGCIAHLERAVPIQLRGTGRALFSAVTIGLGGFVGTKVAGIVYDMSGARTAFQMAALVDLIAPVVLLASAMKYRAMAETEAKPTLVAAK